MNRRRFLALSVGAGAAAGLNASSFRRGLHRVEKKSIALGSEVSLVAYHEDVETAESAVSAALQAVAELEGLLSLYRPGSELCRLNREGVLKTPHRDTLAVVRGAIEWARLTGGAFDPTVQPLWSLHSSTQPPTASGLETTRHLVDWRQVKISPKQIRLARGQQITLNGIAPGFAADRVREILVSRGIKQALFNTGEFGALGNKPEGGPWKIGIQHPRVRDAYAALVRAQDRFVSTSGDYETKFNEDFSRHHIFDPATGLSPTELSSVTVLAPTGLEADALSTAIFVLGPVRGLDLARERKDVDALLILKNGDSVSTPGFPKMS